MACPLASKLFLAATLGLALLPAALYAAPDYAEAVQPLLTARCVRCHGDARQESGLRLDTAGWLFAGGNRGTPVVPGSSDNSLLVQAVQGVAADLPQMPHEGPPLAADEIAGLRAWIDAGALVPESALVKPARRGADHWAYQPIRRPEPPSVQQAGWVRNPIDAFILARLEAQRLSPSPEADRATLARRLSLDLLGLLPTPEEVDAFVADAAPDAYARYVERLLASPHYGERWARHWLDQARYADSNGFTIDSGRNIWKYRDWVIQAINRDLPFDEFAIEQLAGDLLPEATLEQRIATGFHRNTLFNEEGGTDPEQFRVEAVSDRVNTTASVFLGLTLGCARCHDHKYDPLSQREYYQLFAFFNNADEPVLSVPTDQQAKEEPALLADIAALEKRLAIVDTNSGVRQAQWEARVVPLLNGLWTVATPASAEAASGAALAVSADGSLLVQAAAPAADEQYTLTFDLPVQPSALRLEVLTDAALPALGPGLAGDGSFLLTEVQAALLGADGAELPLPPTLARPDGQSLDSTVAQAIDGQAATGWMAQGSDRAVVVAWQPPAAAPAGTVRLQLKLQFAGSPAKPLGRFRASFSSAAAEAVRIPSAVAAALLVPLEERTPEQLQLIRDDYNTIDQERVPLNKQLAELQERLRQLRSAVTTTLVVQERNEPRSTHVMIRGDFLRPGAAVEPGVPAVLPALAASGRRPTRLDFARWLFSPENPLTARVTVNRVWMRYFGVGIVETENDFGAQGSPPTHPELLDWLAGEFIARGWSLKELHRVIVSSATYRQSSAFRADVAAADPYNHGLARQARFRLEAEVIRDAALSASGLLNPEVGGPGVYPPQPEGIYRFTQVAKFWNTVAGPDRFRRGMYVFFWRSSPYPFLVTFDAPDANSACTRRTRSNTPLQALTLANDKAFLELAQGLARRTLAATGDDQQRLSFAFRCCFARPPAAGELARLQEFLAQQRQAYALDAAAATAAAGAQLPGDVPAAEAAAWAAVARVLMNLDEFVTRE